jgi:hypothetical protein|tara:strand:+ start:877 stop:1128 length:252 start_codon:yes stop_codon:yes gene_type:complete
MDKGEELLRDSFAMVLIRAAEVATNVAKGYGDKHKHQAEGALTVAENILRLREQLLEEIHEKTKKSIAGDDRGPSPTDSEGTN